RLGTQYCPDCQRPVQAQTRDELGRALAGEVKKRGPVRLLAPVVKNRKGFHTDVAEWAARHGDGEVRADGRLLESSERLRLDRFREHDVEIVTGRLAATRPDVNSQQLIDKTLSLGNGTLLALDDRGQVSVHSTERSCPNCGRSFEALDPKNFSYNSPQGWCLRCRGFGELFYLPEVDRGARAEAIEESWFEWQEGQRELCPECEGARLNPIARAVRLDLGARPPSTLDTRHSPLTIDTLAQMPVKDARNLFSKLKFTARAAAIARDILPEIRERLKFLDEVG